MNTAGDFEDGSPMCLDENQTNQLFVLMKRGVFCDALLRITDDGTTMPIHRVVLASGSEFFRALFTYDMKDDSEHNEVKLSGVSTKTMKLILEYMYMREVKINEDNFEDLFIAADRFLIFGLQKLCCDFLLSNVGVENCLGVFNFLCSKGCSTSITFVRDFILQNFEDIAKKSQEFLQMNVENLKTLLRHDDLQTSDESEVYTAVRRWVEFEPIRIEHSKDLYNCIRLSFIDQEFLEEQCQNDEILYSCCNEHRIIRRETRRRKKSDPPCIDLIDTSKYVSRPRVPRFVLFALGGWSSTGVVSTAETYDINVNKWYSIEYNMPHQRSYHATLAFNDHIYVVGGFDGQRYLSSAYSFNTNTKIWMAKSSMFTRRCYVAGVVLEKSIYACGGFDGVNRLDTVECFHPRMNQWQQMPPMANRRSDAGASVLKGMLYVGGGFDGHTCLRSVEMFNPRTAQWTTMTQLLSRRSGVCLVTLHDSVVALGGYDGTTRLRTAEQYSPERNTWMPIPDMTLGRSNFAAATFGNKIVVIGGYDGSTTSDSVEMYDRLKKKWTKIASLLSGKSALSACVLQSFDNARDFTYHGFNPTVGDIAD